MAEEKKKSGLDRRQRDIKVGAGLEEARYNVEFIDALRRWGPTVMLVIAAAAMAFWGLQKYRENRDAKQGVAFGELDQAVFAGVGADVNPDVLVRIAEDNANQGAVPVITRLRAAEQWRASAMKGYRPGGMDPKTRTITNPDDYLTSDGKKEFLDKAQAQYKMVVEQTSGNVAKATFTLAGYMGLAAIAETRGEIEAAKAAYKQAMELAEKAHFPEYVALAKSRIETVEKYATRVTLLEESMVNSWDKPQASAPSLLPPSALSGDLTPGTGSLSNPSLSTTPSPLTIQPGLTIPSPTTPAPSPTEPEKKDEPKQP